MTDSSKELQAIGVYDPDAPDAAERLEILEWFLSQGVSIARLAEYGPDDSVEMIASDVARRADENITIAEAARRTGLSEDQIQSRRMTLGLPRHEPNEPVLTEAAARTYVLFDVAEQTFGASGARRFMQVMGTAVSRIGEAAISMASARVIEPLRSQGGSRLDVVQSRYRIASTVGPLAETMRQLLIAHMETTARRLLPGESYSMLAAPLAVGFVDLVGFTSLARQIAPAALAELVDRFEGTAHDVTAARGGRIVKFIGDEVMFVADDPVAACDIALDLVERFADDRSVTPRGALAAGDVIIRGGDYYGAIVNLAARLAGQAVPAEILVTEPVAAAATGGSLRFEPAGRRVLRGFDEPVRVLSVERLSGAR